MYAMSLNCCTSCNCTFGCVTCTGIIEAIATFHLFTIFLFFFSYTCLFTWLTHSVCNFCGVLFIYSLFPSESLISMFSLKHISLLYNHRSVQYACKSALPHILVSAFLKKFKNESHIHTPRNVLPFQMNMVSLMNCMYPHCALAMVH